MRKYSEGSQVVTPLTPIDERGGVGALHNQGGPDKRR